MTFEGVFLVEVFAAILAGEWFLVCMGASMSVECTG